MRLGVKTMHPTAKFETMTETMTTEREPGTEAAGTPRRPPTTDVTVPATATPATAGEPAPARGTAPLPQEPTTDVTAPATATPATAGEPAPARATATQPPVLAGRTMVAASRQGPIPPQALGAPRVAGPPESNAHRKDPTPGASPRGSSSSTARRR